ncbi:MAG: hypothetical protein U0837_09170 [Dehalococcoidia bacterium]|jgi:DNA-binding CsgD family transcriptional regulator
MFQLLDPRALWREISAQHYRAATVVESRVLSLILQGYRNEEIARLMQREQSTVRRHISDLYDRAFAGTDIPRDRDKLKLWGGAHQDCCLPLVKEMIENDRKIA